MAVFVESINNQIVPGNDWSDVVNIARQQPKTSVEEGIRELGVTLAGVLSVTNRSMSVAAFGNAALPPFEIHEMHAFKEGIRSGAEALGLVTKLAVQGGLHV